MQKNPNRYFFAFDKFARNYRKLVHDWWLLAKRDR